MKKAIGYVRVSTEKQVNEGVSLDAQVEKIHAWALYNDYEVIHIYKDEGISGATMKKRPELQKALKAIGKDMAFVCYSLSRLSRTIEDTIFISNFINGKKADLVSINEKIDTTAAAGRMIFNMMAVLNQFEREQISERVTVAMEYKKKENQAYSPTPYGYDRIDDDLVINPVELDIIRRIEKMRIDGLGWQKIANALNEDGIKSKSGKEWLSTTIYRLMQRSNLVTKV